MYEVSNQKCINCRKSARGPNSLLREHLGLTSSKENRQEVLKEESQIDTIYTRSLYIVIFGTGKKLDYVNFALSGIICIKSIFWNFFYTSY